MRQGEGMNFRDTNGDSGDGKYLSKRVMINGQFVTLYSANGNTWVSSPEEIPALMERLDNARITLAPGEKVAEGEPSAAPAKAQPAEDDKAAAPKVLQTKYRMKGPKPRPILRQGGIVIKGTPVEPISASNAALTFSSDVDRDEEESGSKHKASKTSGKAGAPASKVTKGKQDASRKKMIAPVLQRPAAAKPQANGTKVAAKASKAVKSAPVKAPVKPVSKVAAKSASKASAAASRATTSKKAETKKVVASVKKNAASVKRSAARPCKAAQSKKPAKKGKSSKR